MPPQLSKHYPLTASLSNSCPSVFPNHKALPFNSSTSLARYQKEPVVPYLKDVVHHLKEYLRFFPQIMLHWRLSVRTIESERGVEQHLLWELTIQQRIKYAKNKLEALMIIQQGLFQSKILLNFVVDRYLKQDVGYVKKFSEKEVEKLKRLKEHLLELNKFLDCVLLFYSNIDLSCKLPEEAEVKRTTKKLNEVIRFLTPDKIKELIPEGTFTEEDVLCSVLGFQDDFAERLRNVSKEMRSHQTDMYFLLSFMEELYDSCNEESLHDTAAVERRLQEMGFTESRANVIAKWISEQPFAEHKSLLDWAQIYIENLFKYDIFLNDHVKDFPYEERRLNEWFDVSVEREISDCDNNDGVAKLEVPVINTTKEQAVSQIREKIPGFEAEQPHPKLYFHGTDHKGAQDILENGIKLSYCRKGCDFSDGNGFYVANAYQYSLDWTIGKSDASAIMIFSIDNDCLKTFRGLDLSVPDRSEDLKTVRDYFKNGQKKQKCKNKRLMNEVRNCDYIAGPISRDGTKKNPRLVVQQICIKKDDMADKIGNPEHIVGIVFLRKKGNQLARRK